MNRRRAPKIFFPPYKVKKPLLESSQQFKQLIIVVAIVVGVYFFTRLPVFQIKNIDTATIENPEVVSKLNKLLGQSILSPDIANKIREIENSHFEIFDLHCDKGIPDTLRCKIEQRVPIFSWNTGGLVYLIDREGFAYKLMNDMDTVSIDNIVDRSNIEVTVGDQVMSEEIVTIYAEITTILKENNFIIDSLFVKSTALHPGAVLSGRQDGQPFALNKIEVEFSASYPIGIQIKLLSQIIETKAGLIKEKVDLRTPGYVYYK